MQHDVRFLGLIKYEPIKLRTTAPMRTAHFTGDTSAEPIKRMFATDKSALTAANEK